MKLPSIGFIGAGKVGRTLGHYLKHRGLSLCGYYSRSTKSAETAALLVGTAALPLDILVVQSDILFLTVPDNTISSVWQTLSTLPIQDKAVCHCSGMHSSLIFDGISDTGAAGYALHPLCAITGSLNTLEGVCFTLDGPDELPSLKTLIQKIGNPIQRIDPSQKVKYHAAAVFCSNLVNGLVSTGSSLLAQCGLESEFAGQAWRHLFLENAKNIAEQGPVNSLTGAIERGDDKTVKQHLSVLDNPALELYRLLSLEILELAKEKNPERDYTKLEELLK